MKNEDIIRAWRDEDYFLSLSDEQRSFLPANPVGMIELSQDALTTVAGGYTSCAVSCCSDCCNSCASATRPHCCC